MSRPECQRAEEKVEEGFDLDFGKRVDDPVSPIGERQARNLVEVFHRSTGLVLDTGLRDELSDEAMTKIYTECVTLYQDKVYAYGLQANA